MSELLTIISHILTSFLSDRLIDNEGCLFINNKPQPNGVLLIICHVLYHAVIIDNFPLLTTQYNDRKTARCYTLPFLMCIWDLGYFHSK